MAARHLPNCTVVLKNDLIFCSMFYELEVSQNLTTNMSDLLADWISADEDAPAPPPLVSLDRRKAIKRLTIFYFII